MHRTPLLLVVLLTIGHYCYGVEYHKKFVRSCNHKVETVKANTKFCFDMFQQLGTGNSVYSPISVSGVMALVHEGAAGVTYDQIYSGLKWSTMPANCKVKKGFKVIISSLLAPSPSYTVSYVSRVFVDDSYTLKPTFSLVTSYYYSSPATYLPFSTDPLASQGHMNDFVSSNTRPAIHNLISGTSKDTAMVLVNAVTFIGKWVYEFNGNTQWEPFTNSDNSVTSTRMMRYSCKPKSLRHAYLSTLNAELVQLPYQGGNHDLFVFLVNRGSRISALKSALNYATFSSAIRALTLKNVFVKLPKFSHEKKYNLISKFKNLGVNKAFGMSANFSRLSTNPNPLYIDDITHKATINVNEVGTEATAATVVTVCPASRSKRRGGLPLTVQFHANRPFVYVLRQRHSATVEFMGSYERVEGRGPRVEKADGHSNKGKQSMTSEHSDNTW